MSNSKSNSKSNSLSQSKDIVAVGDLDTFPTEIGVICIKQPYVWCISQRLKLIENRNTIPAVYVNQWLALKCTSKFVKSDCDELISLGITIDKSAFEDLTRYQGNVVGLVRFGPSLTKQQAIDIDPTFTNYPKQYKKHYPISHLILFDDEDFLGTNIGNNYIMKIKPKNKHSKKLIQGLKSRFQKYLQIKSGKQWEHVSVWDTYKAYESEFAFDDNNNSNSDYEEIVGVVEDEVEDNNNGNHSDILSTSDSDNDVVDNIVVDSLSTAHINTAGEEKLDELIFDEEPASGSYIQVQGSQNKGEMSDSNSDNDKELDVSGKKNKKTSKCNKKKKMHEEIDLEKFIFQKDNVWKFSKNFNTNKRTAINKKVNSQLEKKEWTLRIMDNSRSVVWKLFWTVCDMKGKPIFFVSSLPEKKGKMPKNTNNSKKTIKSKLIRCRMCESYYKAQPSPTNQKKHIDTQHCMYNLPQLRTIFVEYIKDRTIDQILLCQKDRSREHLEKIETHLQKVVETESGQHFKDMLNWKVDKKNVPQTDLQIINTAYLRMIADNNLSFDFATKDTVQHFLKVCCSVLSVFEILIKQNFDDQSTLCMMGVKYGCLNVGETLGNGYRMRQLAYEHENRIEEEHDNFFKNIRENCSLPPLHGGIDVWSADNSKKKVIGATISVITQKSNKFEKKIIRIGVRSIEGAMDRLMYNQILKKKIETMNDDFCMDASFLTDMFNITYADHELDTLYENNNNSTVNDLSELHEELQAQRIDVCYSQEDDDNNNGIDDAFEEDINDININSNRQSGVMSSMSQMLPALNFTPLPCLAAAQKSINTLRFEQQARSLSQPSNMFNSKASKEVNSDFKERLFNRKQAWRETWEVQKKCISELILPIVGDTWCGNSNAFLRGTMTTDRGSAGIKAVKATGLISLGCEVHSTNNGLKDCVLLLKKKCTRSAIVGAKVQEIFKHYHHVEFSNKIMKFNKTVPTRFCYILPQYESVFWNLNNIKLNPKFSEWCQNNSWLEEYLKFMIGVLTIVMNFINQSSVEKVNIDSFLYNLVQCMNLLNLDQCNAFTQATKIPRKYIKQQWENSDCYKEWCDDPQSQSMTLNAAKLKWCDEQCWWSYPKDVQMPSGADYIENFESARMLAYTLRQNFFKRFLHPNMRKNPRKKPGIVGMILNPAIASIWLAGHSITLMKSRIGSVGIDKLDEENLRIDFEDLAKQMFQVLKNEGVEYGILHYRYLAKNNKLLSQQSNDNNTNDSDNVKNTECETIQSLALTMNIPVEELKKKEWFVGYMQTVAQQNEQNTDQAANVVPETIDDICVENHNSSEVANIVQTMVDTEIARYKQMCHPLRKHEFWSNNKKFGYDTENELWCAVKKDALLFWFDVKHLFPVLLPVILWHLSMDISSCMVERSFAQPKRMQEHSAFQSGDMLSAINLVFNEFRNFPEKKNLQKSMKMNLQTLEYLSHAFQNNAGEIEKYQFQEEKSDIDIDIDIDNLSDSDESQMLFGTGRTYLQFDQRNDLQLSTNSLQNEPPTKKRKIQ